MYARLQSYLLSQIYHMYMNIYICNFYSCTWCVLKDMCANSVNVQKSTSMEAHTNPNVEGLLCPPFGFPLQFGATPPQMSSFYHGSHIYAPPPPPSSSSLPINPHRCNSPSHLLSSYSIPQINLTFFEKINTRPPHTHNLSASSSLQV